MSDEKRLRDEEIDEILDRAIQAGAVQPQPPGEAGLTLDELKDVVAEVGVEPRLVVEAAAALQARQDVAPARKSFGMVVSVDRVVDLPRRLTDSEWENLVAEVRRTFGARGWVNVHGGLREWTNGNLYIASSTDGETGSKLRMGTLSGSATRSNAFGATIAGIGAVLLLVSMVQGEAEWLADGALAVVLLVTGLGALLFNALRLPEWREERQLQFEALAARIAGLLETGQHEQD